MSVAVKQSSLEDARQRLLKAAASLSPAFPERDAVLTDLVTCLVAGEHLVMIGPPGTAKSQLARAWSAVCGAGYFEYLLTPFTEPNELFGPVAIESFRAGEYKRVVEGMAPSAEVFFIDEAFKASSAILNSLLSLLNERLYHSGKQIIASPLQSAILASNEYPAGNLTAMWDRCLVRHEVRPLQHADNLRALLSLALPTAPGAPVTSVADAKALREVAGTLPIEKSAVDALMGIYGTLGSKNVRISDRRKVLATKYLRSVAALEGATGVTDDHIARLDVVLWEKPEQRDECLKVLEKFAASWQTKVRDTTRALDALRKELDGQRQRPDLTELARLNKEARGLAEKTSAALTKHKHRPGVTGLVTAVEAFADDVRAFAVRAIGGAA